MTKQRKPKVAHSPNCKNSTVNYCPDNYEHKCPECGADMTAFYRASQTTSTESDYRAERRAEQAAEDYIGGFCD